MGLTESRYRPLFLPSIIQLTHDRGMITWPGLVLMGPDTRFCNTERRRKKKKKECMSEKEQEWERLRPSRRRLEFGTSYLFGKRKGLEGLKRKKKKTSIRFTFRSQSNSQSKPDSLSGFMEEICFFPPMKCVQSVQPPHPHPFSFLHTLCRTTHSIQTDLP